MNQRGQNTMAMSGRSSCVRRHASIQSAFSTRTSSVGLRKDLRRLELANFGAVRRSHVRRSPNFQHQRESDDPIVDLASRSMLLESTQLFVETLELRSHVAWRRCSEKKSQRNGQLPCELSCRLRPEPFDVSAGETNGPSDCRQRVTTASVAEGLAHGPNGQSIAVAACNASGRPKLDVT